MWLLGNMLSERCNGIVPKCNGIVAKCSDFEEKCNKLETKCNEIVAECFKVETRCNGIVAKCNAVFILSENHGMRFLHLFGLIYGIVNLVIFAGRKKKFAVYTGIIIKFYMEAYFRASFSSLI